MIEFKLILKGHVYALRGYIADSKIKPHRVLFPKYLSNGSIIIVYYMPKQLFWRGQYSFNRYIQGTYKEALQNVIQTQS